MLGFYSLAKGKGASYGNIKENKNNGTYPLMSILLPTLFYPNLPLFYLFLCQVRASYFYVIQKGTILTYLGLSVIKNKVDFMISPIEGFPNRARPYRSPVSIQDIYSIGLWHRGMGRHGNKGRPPFFPIHYHFGTIFPYPLSAAHPGTGKRAAKSRGRFPWMRPIVHGHNRI